MIDKLANLVQLTNIDSVYDDEIILEDCGEIDEQLDGYCIVIQNKDINKMQEIYNEVDPKNSEHVGLILANRRGPVIVHTAITNQAGVTLTEYVLENCDDNIDRFLDFFGKAHNTVPTRNQGRKVIHQQEEYIEDEYEEELPMEQEPEDNYDTYEDEDTYSQLPEYEEEEEEEIEDTYIQPAEYEEEPPTEQNESDDDIFAPEDFNFLTNLVIEKDPTKSAYIKQITSIYNSGNIETGSNLLVTVLDELSAKGLL